MKLQLSKQRAAYLRDLLIKLGVDENRFSVAGMGAGTPIADNKTSAGRRQNNRVDVIYESKEPKNEIVRILLTLGICWTYAQAKDSSPPPGMVIPFDEDKPKTVISNTANRSQEGT